MANVIRLKHNTTNANAPSSLEYGELGVNAVEGVVYLKDTTDTIRRVNGGGVLFQQIATPVNPREGDMWYRLDTEDLFSYREVSTSVFNWVPVVLGTDDSDTIDGGNY